MKTQDRLHEARAGGSVIPTWLVCLLLTFAALHIHGYHPYAEDAGIYVPAIKKQLDPSLYPKASEFFMLPAHWSIFTLTVAGTARVSHLPVSYLLLLWYLACLFFTIAACWCIAELCFGDRSVGLLGAVLTTATISMPAAGSALLLSDPYLTSRSVSTPLVLFSIVYLLKKNVAAAVFCCIAAIAFHPLMGLIGGLFLVLLAIADCEKRQSYILGAMALFFLALLLAYQASLPLSEQYQAAAETRSYFFLNRWTWYELVGAVVPISTFACIAVAFRGTPGSPVFRISFASAALGVVALSYAAAFTWIPALLPFARLQPMRVLQLLYFLFLLVPITAGLRTIVHRRHFFEEMAFALALVSLAVGIYEVQRATFPASNHVEWPWSKPANLWQQAFEWIRLNTPKSAVFALDADYPNDAGDDRQGFRAEAERSALPDRAKDGGVAALFPQLATPWQSATSLTTHLDDLSDEYVNELQLAGVSWVVVPSNSSRQLNCPYSNRAVSVCELNATSFEAKKEPR